MLPCEITDLAGLGLGCVARGLLATLVRVQVGKGTGAIAVGGHGGVVDVVDFSGVVNTA